MNKKRKEVLRLGSKAKDILRKNSNKVKELLMEGLSERAIAEELGISYSTYRQYKTKDSVLKSVYEELKISKDDEVERSLFKLCNGFVYTEEIATKVKNEIKHPDGSVEVSEDVKISHVKKYCKPDLNAQKYWLNNRKSDKWKDDKHKVKRDKEMLELKKKEVQSKVIDID